MVGHLAVVTHFETKVKIAVSEFEKFDLRFQKIQVMLESTGFENALNRNLIQNDFLVQEREIKVIDRTALI